MAHNPEDKNKDPIVAPPLRLLASSTTHRNITVVPPASLTWLDELNLDPRNRAVAALGTQVIQSQQER